MWVKWITTSVHVFQKSNVKNKSCAIVADHLPSRFVVYSSVSICSRQNATKLICHQFVLSFMFVILVRVFRVNQQIINWKSIRIIWQRCSFRMNWNQSVTANLMNGSVIDYLITPHSSFRHLPTYLNVEHKIWANVWVEQNRHDIQVYIFAIWFLLKSQIWIFVLHKVPLTTFPKWPKKKLQPSSSTMAPVWSNPVSPEMMLPAPSFLPSLVAPRCPASW